jgi:CheY-like chemotaxis protein
MAYKLLLADDSITIQKIVELILADEGFEIKAFNNGQEALASIPSFKPDIVLADVEMPKMNGYQLCEKIKQNPDMQDIPVVLLATSFEPIDEDIVKEVKADDFIIKPFESQELISKLHALLTVSAVVGEEAESLPETEGLAETEAIGLEEAAVEEDLWAMEEIPETAEVESWPGEEELAAPTEELAEIIEGVEGEEAEAVPAEEEPITPVRAKAEPAEIKTTISEVEKISKEDIKNIFEKTINEKITSSLSALEIKEAVLSALTPLLKDSIEKILWEITPDLTEKMLKEMLKGSLESLTKEVEKVIWETVPDLAETMISKEIERIRSEF